MLDNDRQPNDGRFTLTFVAIAIVHFLLLGLLLFFSFAHSVKKEQNIVWVNPGSFGSNAIAGEKVALSEPELSPAEKVSGPDAPQAKEERPIPDTTPAEEITPAPLPTVPDIALPEPTISTTPRPTPKPSRSPTPRPSVKPTPKPTRSPTPKPTPKATPSPTPKTTPKASPKPSPKPSASPRSSPSPEPSHKSEPKAKAKTKETPESESSPKPEPSAKTKEPSDKTAGTAKPRTSPDRTDHSGEKDLEKPSKNQAAKESADNSGTSGGGEHGPGTGSGDSTLAAYVGILTNRFQAAWNQPTGEMAMGKVLEVTVRLKIEPDGKVTEFTIVKGSGNAVVDESVREAGKSITRLPPPPNHEAFSAPVRFELGN